MLRTIGFSIVGDAFVIVKWIGIVSLGSLDICGFSFLYLTMHVVRFVRIVFYGRALDLVNIKISSLITHCSTVVTSQDS